MIFQRKPGFPRHAQSRCSQTRCGIGLLDAAACSDRPALGALVHSVVDEADDMLSRVT